ncbi:MAG: hypothetical protein HKO90_02615 [Flavobacteriaceae bacterium]|nr:hypothetical protein [Flavobacteriaceae bacterium]
MCTVTFIPTSGNDFILTSNRDESPERKTFMPDYQVVDKRKLLYPMDANAGGTWIGISDRNRLVCVLNGAFKKHKRKPPYRESRGNIAKTLLVATSTLEAIDSLDCSGIEPFTMIILDWKQDLRLLEFIWDGNKKYLTHSPNAPRLWSSSTLYDEHMKAQRQQWFEDFREEHRLTPDVLLDFHEKKEAGNLDYGLVMNRGYVQTTSITQVQRIGTEVSMLYKDLVHKRTIRKNLRVSQLSND